MPIAEKFANRFFCEAHEAAAGTAAFTEVPTYLNAFEKKAFVIHRLEYNFENGIIPLMAAAGDMVCAALTTTNVYTTLRPQDILNEPGLHDYVALEALMVGAAAGRQDAIAPIIHDFTELPGGGLIVPGRPLFVGAYGYSLANPVHVSVRGWFSIIELKAEEFLDLVDAYRIVTK